MAQKRRRMSYERRRRMMGYAFIAPWLVGSVVFFLLPLIQLFIYSFSTLTFEVGGLKIDFSGPQNYIDIFTKDRDATKLLMESFGTILLQTVYITLLSLFIANILRQKFRGRLFARAISVSYTHLSVLTTFIGMPITDHSTCTAPVSSSTVRSGR